MKHSIPTTDETRSDLGSAGVGWEDIPEDESTAQMLLAIVNLEDDPDWSPDCFRKEYDPDCDVCGACALRAPCWTSDLTYLKGLQKGSNSPPPDTPKVLIEKALARTKRGNRRVPPSPTK